MTGIGGEGDMVMFPDGDSKLLSNMVDLIYTGRWVILCLVLPDMEKASDPTDISGLFFDRFANLWPGHAKL